MELCLRLKRVFDQLLTTTLLSERLPFTVTASIHLYLPMSIEAIYREVRRKMEAAGLGVEKPKADCRQNG